MKISLKWMQQYVPVALPAKELADRLTMQGLNVEGIIERNAFPGIVIGKVLEVHKHPNADKLSLTRVDIGKEEVAIVCGAPNVKAGQLVPVATVGTVMPGGLEIKKAKIRGEESSGMICSKSELGFEKEKSPGIWELEGSLTPGRGFAESMNLGDTILDIDVTSNRPDCLNFLGIARETAAMQNQKLRMPDSPLTEAAAKTDARASVQIEDAEGCPRYAARIVLGIRQGPSPSWLVDCLEAAGLRSINNIVDVTNFVMLECGQPLHAFDFDQLAGGRIVVKRSRSGETFTTLDGKTHKLNSDTVMICDSERPIAIGGIMGGKNSEISDSTVNIFLESAFFDPVRIRRSAKHLGMTTDASVRFERGVDPLFTVRALDRAASLIAQLAGGQVLAGTIDVNRLSLPGKKITLHAGAVKKLLAQSIAPDEIRSILERLECTVTGISAEEWQVVPPSFRQDLVIPEDLIEEIARFYGYNKLPAAAGASVQYDHEENRSEKFGRAMRIAFREMGFSEIVTNSMVDPQGQRRVIDAPGKAVKLLNPISEETSVMRQSLLPSLFEVVRGNLFRKNSDLRLYEIGRIYMKSDSEPAVETTVLCGCLCGSQRPVHWSGKPESADFYDGKGMAEVLCEKFMLDSVVFNPYSSSGIFSPGSLEIMISPDSGKGVSIGHFGKIRKNILRDFDIDADVWAFEFDYSEWMRRSRFKRPFSPISRFPSIQRDLALTVDRTLAAGVVTETIRKNAGEHLHALTLFDQYTGDQIAPDKKSLAFSLQFQSPERTLTEEEIDRTMQAILSKVAQELNAQLRS